jgi:hypothetical protein
MPAKVKDAVRKNTLNAGTLVTANKCRMLHHHWSQRPRGREITWTLTAPPLESTAYVFAHSYF